MKRTRNRSLFMVVLATFAMIFFVAKSDFFNEKENILDFAQMELEQTTLPSNAPWLRANLINQTDYQVQFKHFYLDYYDGNHWQELGMLNMELAPWAVVMPGESVSFNHNLRFFRLDGKEGRYRIRRFVEVRDGVNFFSIYRPEWEEERERLESTLWQGGEPAPYGYLYVEFTLWDG